MRGRQVFMDSLVAHGADAIFGNPGTTENPLLDSLLDYPAINYYVALHEGVAVGAAGYYARASGKTAIANLHVAPGFGNAIGMLYGVLKGSAPVIVTAGQQDTRFRLRDPILRHDLVAMAAPVTKWAVEPQSADELGEVMRRAFKIANDPPMGPVFVALPINVMEQETDFGAVTTGPLYREVSADQRGIEHLAEALLASKNPVVVAGDEVSNEGAQDALVTMAETTGAGVFIEYLHTRQPISNRHPNYCGRIPYEFGLVRKALEDHDLVMMIGGQFFEEVWYDDVSPFADGAVVAQLESAESRLAHNFALDIGLVGGLKTSLEALTEAVRKKATDATQDASKTRNAGYQSAARAAREQAVANLERQRGANPMAPAEALAVVAQSLPEGTIVVDETITGALDLAQAIEAKHDSFYGGRGGGIGQCLAGALGIAAANQDKLVAAFSGDGSAMYSIQALWTAAHHDLNLLYVIMSNREYRVLKHNLDTYRRRFDALAERPYPHMDLSEPHLGFVDMARGMGVPGSQATTPDEIRAALSEALKQPGPYLLDLVVAGK